MKIVFDIPYPQTKKGKAAFNRRFGLNAYYAGKSWPERKRDAEELHTLAVLSMRKAGVGRRLVERPVGITFFWDDRLDADNHAVMGKAFVDAMKGYILPDDNRQWVKRVSHEFWNGGCIRCEIEEVKSQK